MSHTDGVVDDFVVARNPEEGSKLPYLLRLPVGGAGVVLKSREVWPRTSKVYCHRATEWPADPDVIERVPVRSCVRRGAAIDLVLDRGRENRSQFVLTRIRDGREAIFWQTARTAKQARPNVGVPGARASGLTELEIVVDSRERYAYRFAKQQATTIRAALTVGDYGIVDDGRLLACVERKSLADLVATLTGGRLKYLLGELASLPRAALVVEDRYSAVFKLDRVRPSLVADGLAEVQVRWPNVPLVFCETRALAEEWTFRFLGAAAVALTEDSDAELVASSLTSPPPLPPRPPRPPTNADVRRWALDQGFQVPGRGRIPAEIHDAYRHSHSAV